MGPGSAVGLLLLCGLGGAARVLHSLRYFHIAVSDPSPGVPRYQVVGYVDGIPFVRYTSESKRMEPQTQWIKANVDQEYWDTQTQVAWNHQQITYEYLDIAWDRYNESGGTHTLQHMYGCDLLDNGSSTGYDQIAYDGKDFIAFDMDTMKFIAADAAAQVTKKKWEHDGNEAELRKKYLKNICVEWLKKYVRYGQLVLERRVPPTVRVSEEEKDGILTLTCRAHGFYPWPIIISWLKDGEVRDQDTQWGRIAPNSDGTYYMWASIKTNAKDKDRFRCQVEHSSLLQPGLYSLESQSKLYIALMVATVVVVIVLSIIVAGVFFWKRKLGKNKEDGYNMPPGMDMGSASSPTGIPA